MSLLNTASPWTTDETSKKRQPTMRKTIKLKPPSSEDLHDDIKAPPSIEQTQAHMEDRTHRVNNLLDKITASNDHEATQMGAFVPISNPNINIKKEEKGDLTTGRLHPPVQILSQLNRQKIGQFSANDSAASVYSNYLSSYENPTMFKKENSVPAMRPITDNKVLEKINYMIHLLEEQQHEKTSNITEEFILYTFLGVFIIFVVDSFSRSGKYTR